MVIGFLIIGTTFAQVVLFLMENYLFGYEDEHLLLFLIKNSVLVVGDLIQSWCLILGIFSAPPYLASIKYMRPLYIIPSLPFSFRALRSC